MSVHLVIMRTLQRMHIFSLLPGHFIKLIGGDNMLFVLLEVKFFASQVHAISFHDNPQ